ncbi:unnamed protein product [Arabis nemorensis]|uniref:Uncharacterized protein n=1 Tax=Arabis nemorensis TaxID=586526 RepID=A0A565CGG7_9BRAS|nr:unnamed protein product [Arabis nemorensis]
MSTFYALGSLHLRESNKRFKKITTHEERETTVRVIWDVNTCPLRDEGNGFVYDPKSFKENISKALHHLSPKLRVEEKMFAAGVFSAGDSATFGQVSTIVKCDHRFYVCSGCKGKEGAFTPKTTPEVFTTLQEHLLGDAIDRDSPGIVLLISSDSDFIPTVDFLRENKFVILLAQQEAKAPNRLNNCLNKDFRNHCHYTYLWKNLRVGNPPSYQCDFPGAGPRNFLVLNTRNL